MKDKKQLPVTLIALALGINLLFGYSVYSETVSKDKSDQVESVRVLVDAVSILRKNYVDADKVSYQKLVYAALEGMVKELDKHSRFHKPAENSSVKEDTAGEFAGIGVILNFKDKKLTVKRIIPGGPAEKSDLKAGDIIVKVGDYTLKGEGFSEAKKHIKGERGTPVTLTVLRGEEGSQEEVLVKVIRDIVKVPSITRVRVLPETELGYLYIAQFTRETAVDFRSAVTTLLDKNVRGLVVDLRSNPGGLLDSVVSMCSYFLEKNDLVIYTKGREKAQQKKYYAHGGVKFKDIPIVILINAGSASASEIFSACMHDYGKAVLIGEKTYGKGSVQTIVDLRDGSAIRFTIAKYYTKSGVTIHNVGIKPDIDVKLDKEEQREVNLLLSDLYPLDSDLAEYDKKDRQLQTAISVLQSINDVRKDHPPLKIYKDNKEAILKNADAFINVPEKEEVKGTSAEEK